MFKFISDWWITRMGERANLGQEDSDRRTRWKEMDEERAVVVPLELLQKLIESNPEYMKARITPVYWHTGEFWHNDVCDGNFQGNLEEKLKRLIYANLKRGISYDDIIKQLSDPKSFMMNKDKSDE